MTTFGTTANAIAIEQGNAVAATLGALAQGQTPEQATAAANQLMKTNVGCGS